MLNRATMICAVALSMAGCSFTETPTDGPSTTGHPTVKLNQVTLHVVGMNQRLQILWGDWPNKVKQALSGLDGVEAVKDEWEQESESAENVDRLFVEYDADRVTVDKMLETIKEQGFDAARE